MVWHVGNSGVGQLDCRRQDLGKTEWYNRSVESTAHLIRDHVASGGRLIARQKEIIADLKKRGVDATEAERTLAQLSA